MAYHAKIIGLSGRETYLDRKGGETEAKRHARRFRASDSALAAARAFVGAFAPVVARNMQYEAVPADDEAPEDHAAADAERHS